MWKYKVGIFSVVNKNGVEIEQEILKEIDAQVMNIQTEEDFERMLPEIDGLIIADAAITEEVLDKLEKCKVVVRQGMGTDNIDIPAATARGIQVCNTPGFNIREVADHALASALCLARYIPFFNHVIKNEKKWSHLSFPAPKRVGAMEFGIIGFGKIGQLLASKAKGIFGNITTFDPYLNRDAAAEHGVEGKNTLEELFQTADIISLHVPLTPETHHLLNKNTFAHMKPGMFVINTSRGSLIDEEALLWAIREKIVAGAFLDVIENEWEPDLEAPLFKEPRIIFTPHTAWYSQDSLHLLRTVPAQEVRDALLGKRPVGRVN